ncbi:MAG: alpha/beta hydrolase [Sedimentisphaerales bacterium]|nr:alpha/beta hydrolase [Sedimentisphaerales bacterium]
MKQKASRPLWKRVVLIFVELMLGMVILIYVVVQIEFRRWRRELCNTLRNGSALASTDRGEIEYTALGQGPVVLFLHGAPGGYDQALFINGYCVVAPSRPGYLRTQLCVGPTFVDQARACAALLDSLKIEQVAVLGFSAGGPLALQFATQYPERTWAMILVSAVTKKRIVPPPKASGFRRMTDHIFGQDFTDWLVARAVTQFPQRLLLDQANELLSTEDRDILRKDPEKLKFLIDTVATKMGPWSLRHKGDLNDTIQLAQISEQDPLLISAPTLVIHGTADEIVDTSHADSVKNRIPNSELAMIEGAGHAIWFAHYTGIESLVLQFLNKHAPYSKKAQREKGEKGPGAFSGRLMNNWAMN